MYREENYITVFLSSLVMSKDDYSSFFSAVVLGGLHAGRAAAPRPPPPPPKKNKLETASFSGNLFPNFGEFGRLDTGHGGIRERNDSSPPPPQLAEIPYAYVISLSTLNVC